MAAELTGRDDEIRGELGGAIFNEKYQRNASRYRPSCACFALLCYICIATRNDRAAIDSRYYAHKMIHEKSEMPIGLPGYFSAGFNVHSAQGRGSRRR